VQVDGLARKPLLGHQVRQQAVQQQGGCKE
jgi:hypothetical protein